MSAYIVAEVVIEDPVQYERYRKLVPPTIALYGGRYLVRGGPVTTLEGTWQPRRFVIVEFPSAERARAWWDSPEYADAKALRQTCARTDMILVDGVSSQP